MKSISGCISYYTSVLRQSVRLILVRDTLFTGTDVVRFVIWIPLKMINSFYSLIDRPLTSSVWILTKSSVTSPMKNSHSLPNDVIFIRIFAKSYMLLCVLSDKTDTSFLQLGDIIILFSLQKEPKINQKRKCLIYVFYKASR